MRAAVVVLLVALVTGCGVQGGAAPAPPDPDRSVAAPTPSPEVSRPAPATAVRIDAIGVEEPLVDLGLTDSGELEVPADPARVGWFTGGGRPGGPGPTVIVGHVDSADGPAVFARLPELTTGDSVVVTSSGGRETRYVVRDAQTFSQDPGDFPTEAVFGATGTDALRLITCTGPYDEAAGRYTQNRVVFAEPA